MTSVIMWDKNFSHWQKVYLIYAKVGVNIYFKLTYEVSPQAAPSE